MDEWKWCRLGDLITLEYGSALREQSRTGSGFSVYGSNGVVGYHEKALVPGPGIIIGRKGSIGQIHWSEDGFWPIDTTYYLNPRVKLDLRWILGALNQLGLKLLGSSTGVPGLNRNDAYQRKVPVPPLKEQKRIAEILDSLDQTIQATEQLITKHRKIQTGLIDQFFTPSTDSPTELGAICFGPGEYGCVATAEPLRPGWPRYVRITDITDNGTLKSDSEMGVSPTVAQKAILCPGDIVFARSGTVGRTYLYDTADGLCAFAGYLIRFRPDPDKAIPEFVRWWTHSSFYWRWIKRTMRVAAQPNINAREYAKAVLPLPSVYQQRLIVETLTEVEVEIQAEQRYLTKLQKLRSGLASDLLSGRVRTVAA
ncbi:MAG: hypothetical protein F4Z36_08235 [Acidimicrobiia bacterium]|nr:hypothetical protein [Acidimicrobiia bacterium]